MQRNFKNGLSFIILVALLSAAHAELGGNAKGIDVYVARIKAERRISVTRNYTLHEIQTPTGTTVREYLSPTGTVFAVAWNGPHMPDLRQLFGANFARYQQAASAKAGHRGPLVVDEPELVVQSGGHMRAFYGKAYLPPLIPDGVSVDEIK